MLFVYLLLLVASASAKSYPHRWYDLELADLYFEDFKNTHDRHYETAKEHDKRFQIFKQNLIRYNKNNNKQLSYTSGITRFSDLTQEEVSRRYKGLRGTEGLPMVEFVNDVEDLPASLDWRDKDMVSPVKEQGECGSCWIFSATGLLESSARMQLGSRVLLSEQQLVDCQSDDGCAGGMNYLALEYIQEAGGIESEEDYPYKAKHSNCSFDLSKSVLSLPDFYNLNITIDEDLKAALLKYGPLSFGIDAMGLYDYTGGVFHCDRPLATDHAVLLVGYGTENGNDYWIVKNSWGIKFGEKGYFRMKSGGNTCLMFETGFYNATVSKA